MTKRITSFLTPILLFAPAVVLAQTDGINRLIDQIQVLIMRLIPVVIGLALLLFLFGIVRYVFTKEDTEKGQAKMYMLWGLVALFVMVSVWGLVTILKETFFGGINIDVPPTVPRVPGTR